MKNKPLRNIPEQTSNLRVYPAAVTERDGVYYLSGSRAFAVVGIGPTLIEAEKIAENAASSIDGPVFHRRDIGTEALVQQRIDHVNSFERDDQRVASL